MDLSLSFFCLPYLTHLSKAIQRLYLLFTKVSRRGNLRRWYYLCVSLPYTYICVYMHKHTYRKIYIHILYSKVYVHVSISALDYRCYCCCCYCSRAISYSQRYLALLPTLKYSFNWINSRALYDVGTLHRYLYQHLVWWYINDRWFINKIYLFVKIF